MAPLDLTREQILAFRRRVSSLGERLPAGGASLRQAAWAGLQDSMPRAALLSIHARVEGAGPSSWEDPALVQLWGPRYSAYVVPAQDIAPFSLGRLPDDTKGRRRAQEMAALLQAYLAGKRVIGDDAGDALGVHPNALRYGATTGTVLMRWDGARRPTVWTVPPPDVDPIAARLELARRFLHVFGPSTSAGFARWAGITDRAAAAAFELLSGQLAAARTPIGQAWLLASDQPEMTAEPGPDAAARLLPSGDTYYLLWGDDRGLLVPDPARRSELWTSRVWPGALLVDGEIRGTWRRAEATVTVDAWDDLSDAERDAVEAEAAALPLPGVEGRIRVIWNT